MSQLWPEVPLVSGHLMAMGRCRTQGVSAERWWEGGCCSSRIRLWGMAWRDACAVPHADGREPSKHSAHLGLSCVLWFSSLFPLLVACCPPANTVRCHSCAAALGGWGPLVVPVVRWGRWWRDLPSQPGRRAEAGVGALPCACSGLRCAAAGRTAGLCSHFKDSSGQSLLLSV